MEKIAIIIPAYNEEKRIGKTLQAYSEYFEDIRIRTESDYEILVVINNTKDKTEEIVRTFAGKNKRIGYLNFKEGGKGFAVIEGFKDALTRDNALIGFVDADFATKPEHFYDLVRKMGSKDGSIASRYIPGAIINPRPTFSRLVAKRMFNTVVRSLLFLPYKDTQCGAKVFRRGAIERTISSITMSQWAFDVDLLYSIRKKGFKIKEVPTVWSDMAYSKLNFWKAGPRMALGVVRLRLLNSPFRIFLRVYEGLPKEILRW